MISRKTVLVLGAGASYHAGFPLGSELSEKILDVINSNDSHIKSILKSLVLSGTIESFKTEFADSGSETIDEFLMHRKEYRKLGKILICLALIPFENQIKLRNRKGNWYYLLNKAMSTTDRNAFVKNEISFITFNYDRSLENSLFLNLTHTYGFSDSQAASILRKFNILHLHGSLGNHPYNDDRAIEYFSINSNQQNDHPFNPVKGTYFFNNNSIEEYYRLYNPTITYDCIKNSFQEIKIIHEDEKQYLIEENQLTTKAENSDKLSLAIKLMNEAEIIVFLGFGFHNLNVERLKLIDCKCSEIYSSAYGLSSNKIKQISKSLNYKIPEENFYNKKIYELLEDDILLDNENPVKTQPMVTWL